MLIAIIDEHSFTRECICRFLRGIDACIEVTPFMNCEELLNNSKNHDIILYHDHQEADDSHNIDQRFVKITILTQIAHVIILSSVECHISMIEAFESGARGFIPTASTTPAQVIEIARLVKAGGTFVPSSLSVRGSNGSARPVALTTPKFTSRELAILECLRLGKANKIIARELRLSESTVKVHIRSIMKKLRATNRTEAVCRAYDLGGGAAPSRHEA